MIECGAAGATGEGMSALREADIAMLPARPRKKTALIVVVRLDKDNGDNTVKQSDLFRFDDRSIRLVFAC